MTVHTAVAVMLVASGILTSAPVPSPQPATSAPQTHEIFLAGFSDGEGRRIQLGFIGIQKHGFTVAKPRNITNRASDDDAPCFLPDSSGVLFSSNRDRRQRDIYRYDIATKALTRVTTTPEDERWPRMTPDGRTFTAVRGAQQQLWRLNLDGSDAGPAAMHVAPIRNYVWVSPAKIAQWMPDSQGAGTLALVDIKSGSSEVMASNVGPFLNLRPRTGAVTFVSSPLAGHSQVKELDPATRKVATYAPTLDGGDALAWTPSDRLLMAAGGKLFVRENETDRWIENADLRKAGLTAITTISVSPDGKWMAIAGTVAK
jgi:dipeptidyl aminopeptidase/acylaminoacyl peptidase